MEYAVEAKGLTTQLGVKTILDNIDLAVAVGQHTMVFGPNGCGKTTLLGTLCGYTAFTSGSVHLFGVPLSCETAGDLREQVSFVSNSYFNRILKRETSFNIVLGGAYGAMGEQWETGRSEVLRAKHLLSSLGIGRRGMYPYDMLSYGEQQRVLIARALMMKPRLLVLDEPTSGLDVASRAYLMNTVREIAALSGTTIISCTHYPEEILELYQQGVLMKAGRIVKAGPIEDVFTSENLTNVLDIPTSALWSDGRMQIEVERSHCIPQEIYVQEEAR